MPDSNVPYVPMLSSIFTEIACKREQIEDVLTLTSLTEMIKFFSLAFCRITVYSTYLYVLCLPNVVPERGDAGGRYLANQKIQLRDDEHALLLVEGQVAGGEDGEPRAELGRHRSI